MLVQLLTVISALSTSLIVCFMIYALIITLFGSKDASTRNYGILTELPEVSVIIPVKDEFNNLRLSLSQLTRVNYPVSKLKIYVGVDEGCPQCLDVCKDFGQRVTPVIVSSKTKPAVLNELIRLVSSEYVLLLDCDSLVTPNSIINLVSAVVKYGSCGATGIPKPSNPCMGMLPKFFIVETFLWRKLMKGKDYLGLLVQAPGYFTLLKRSCITSVGYWDETSLAEDNDLTLRIYVVGGRIKLVDSEVYVESPSDIKVLIKQRIRWYRGTLEVLSRRWELLGRLNLKLRLDAFATYISPISPTLLILAMISNAVLGGFYNLLTVLLMIPQVITPLAVGKGLTWADRVKLSSLSIPYVLVNSLASLIAVITLLLRIKLGWQRTEKRGYLGGCDD
ncbi:MAG: glycosyltransferase family 2 protein [Sulfolobales archaeon]|nr:glycosyltransferase family 2 protein [Sulfolobales archaeon]MCX8186903.1 glycosyltransferase family 2 protein [Sulfolobales archaeon]